MKRLLPILMSFLLCAGVAWGQSEAPAQDTIVVPTTPEMVTVSGIVTDDETGEPMGAVTIIAGPSVAVITSDKGEYAINVAPGTRLTVQYMGYLTFWWMVPADSPSSVTKNILMKRDLQVMDDVVVVAYGVRQKGTVAGSVSTLKGDKIGDAPTASFDQALQGSTPGLTVMASSGEPSAGATYAIRGTNSINSGTQPLFIMDGIPVSSSDFNAISPADIESITTLKDASSTSIYGARAANGVIVITTKRGKALERAKINFRMQLGLSNLASGKWYLMNTAERIAYEKEIGFTEGKDYDRLGKVDVNWRDEIFGNFAPLQNYELQISGATDRWSYFVSGGYYSQEGLTTDSDFERISFRANAEVKAANWLRLGTNTMFAYETYQRSVSDGSYYLNTPISASRFMLPYHSPYRKDGRLTSINDGTWKGQSENPLEWVEFNPALNKKYKLISTLFLEFQPINGLTIRSQLGLDYSHLAASSRSLASYRPNANIGSASRSSSDSHTLSITNTINYRFDVDKAHQFNFMVGQEGVDFYGESFAVTAEGQVNDKLSSLSNATRGRNWGNGSSAWALVSVFGRGEYDYRSRYYVDFSVRGDWSSRFGRNNRGAAFWSVGLMWNALGEGFIPADVKRWLTTAQIAFSTGTSGNQELPYYDHLALVSGGLDYMGEAALAPVSKGNPDLSWEQLWSTNVALRLGFWNRVGLEIEFYNKLTTKMLMQVPVSYSDAGTGSRWDNIGGMVNRGVEISLNADVVSTQSGFVWNVNGNVSYNRNKITELYGNETEYVMNTIKLEVGRPYGEFYLVRYAGVNPANGDALWYDKNGNITNKYNEEDKVLVGKSYMAPWQGGFGTSLSWKGIALSVQFSWISGRWMVNNDRYFEEGNGILDAYNQSKRLLYDRWKKPGDVTDIPRHGISPQFDSRLLEDASFLRLKNLMLAYSFPPELLKKTKFLSAVKIYFQAQNLFTATKFTGLDPESPSAVYAAEYPASRQFSFGLDVTF